ncbi:MAG: sulfate permease [Desulfobacteraceae bacterium]|nr:sulfate permease [Desulfobacteraceae bacterium]
MESRYKFNRLELAGSFGDMGTLLPIALGMIVFNGLSASGLFFTVGTFYILSGIYYGVTVPVQPMKVIGAYALASGLSASQITASAALMGIVLLVIGGSGAMTFIGRYIPKPVIRGVQTSTGVLLVAQGVRFMAGTSGIQLMQKAAEPYLVIQNIGPVPISVIIGIAAMFLSFYFLDNKKLPAGLIVILAGFIVGLILGTRKGFDSIEIGLYFPKFLPFGVPLVPDFTFAFLALALPQVPMTIGNAVIANADLSKEYFGEKSGKVTYRSLCFSMGFANILSFLFGGMPLCHGAGGLAAHYRFGARTAGSNIMIGLIFVMLAVFLGVHALPVLNLIPMSVLGALLIFAGTQLAITITDMKEREDIFVVMLMLGITLASNLAVGFTVGIIITYALKSEKFSV